MNGDDAHVEADAGGSAASDETPADGSGGGTEGSAPADASEGAAEADTAAAGDEGAAAGAPADADDADADRPAHGGEDADAGGDSAEASGSGAAADGDEGARAATPAEASGETSDGTGADRAVTDAGDTGEPEGGDPAGAGGDTPRADAAAGAPADASGETSADVDGGEEADAGEGEAGARTGVDADAPASGDEGASADGDAPRPPRVRHSVEGVGKRLPDGLADLAAAVKAIERGETPPPVATVTRAAPAAETPAAAAVPAARTAPAAPAAAPPVAAVALPEGAVEAARAVLAAGGAPVELAEAAVAGFGEGAGEALRGDPWLVLGLPRVRVEQADGFARSLLGEAARPGDPRRSRAVLGWLLERAAERGHTALGEQPLGAALRQYGVPDPAGALEAGVQEGTVLVFRADAPTGEADAGAGADDADDAAEVPVPLLFGLDRYALAEESLADGLGRLRGTFEEAARGARGAEEAGRWAAAASGAPSASAAELIRAAAGHGLVVHTGGNAARAEPAALVAAARSLGLRAALADASDAARGFATLPAGADGVFELDLLAVLDAGQLDVETAAALVESVPDGARLVLSGDPALLGAPAGPGQVLADLLAARACPQVASRTPDPGPLGELTSAVAFGELAAVDAPDREIVIVPVRDPGEAVHRAVQLVADSVPRAIGVPPERTVVVVPGHGGPAGTRALNAALKQRLNPGPGRFGGFDPGDRVAWSPAPGRALHGTVVAGDAAGLHLECAGGRVTVPPAAVAVPGTVRHGWAITAHQALGAHWAAVVTVLPGDAGPSLDRAWLYTAFSRAERHLSVVQGVDSPTLARIVAEVPARPRTTRLRTILAEQAADAESES